MASEKRPLFERETYTVGWICALELELTAAMAMLDDYHAPLPKDAKDENSYTLGRIGDHNVVSALLPRTGKANAAIVAANLHRSFPAVRFILMVGIGGGVPSPTTNDIRLGDLAVCKPDQNSGGVVQYDYGKTIAEGKFVQTSRLGPPSPELLSIAGTLRASHAIYGSAKLMAYIEAIDRTHLAESYYRYPGHDRDMLYIADYDGPPGHETCDGCDKSKLYTSRENRESDAPKIFYGTIASGDQVMRHGSTRDRYGKEQNILCFEMEAAGLIENYRCIVIRGICDYADSHKTKEWQNYAATVAAAYGKELLGYLAPGRIAKTPTAEVTTICPYPKNTQFVGRESTLEKIRKELQHIDSAKVQQTARTVVLFGLGGVGKSQIAIAYLYWLHETYPDMSIFWIHAATPDRFHQGYLEIARRCQIPGCEDQASDALQLVKDWLENQDHGKWLMVIDNADNEAAFFETGSQPTELPADVTKKKTLKYYIPRCAHGSVLVTTRDKAVAVSFTSQYKMRRIEVTAMSKAESRELLHGILSDETIDSELGELIDLLDNLPLALVQAGSYIEKTSSSIEDYLEIYRESEDSALDLLDQEFESGGRDLNIPNAVVTSWIISFEQIQAAQPRAAEILSLMAFFDRQAIPESLLRDQDEPLSSFKDSIGKLLAYSLITRSIDKKHFDEHRLAHMISQAWLKRNGNAEKWLIISQERILKRFPKDEYKDWIVCISYLPHARVAINRELENTSGIYNQSISWLMFWVTRFLMLQGSYLLMMEISKQHSDYCLKHLGSKHTDTLGSIDDLAKAFHYLGQYKEAEKLQRQALNGREKLLGPEHPDTVWSINNLAIILRKQGQYKEAEKLYWQAIKGREKLLGPEHPDTLWNISDLATALSYQGQHKEAEKLYWQAIKGREKLLGPEHPDRLQSISNLATVLSNQGQYKEAEKLYWQAIKGMEKLLGSAHPNILLSVKGLTRVLESQGRSEEAQALENEWALKRTQAV